MKELRKLLCILALFVLIIVGDKMVHILPVMVAMNTYNQIRQKNEKQRKEMEYKREIEPQKKENRTSCVEVVYDPNAVYCCYTLLPPANTVMMCNAYPVKERIYEK